MAEKPPFLFYAQDFLVGTLALPMDDRGKYITLLCYMHEHGRMTHEMVVQLIGEVSKPLRAKFKTDEAGLWFNERLEKEIKERRRFIESKQRNGKKGGRPKRGKASFDPSKETKQKELGFEAQTASLPNGEGWGGAPNAYDVKTCFVSRGLSASEAEYETLKFITYYTGRGWKTNKNIPITDWRSAVTNWLKHRNQFTQYKQPKTLTEQWLA
jgi:hypothetical protein